MRLRIWEGIGHRVKNFVVTPCSMPHAQIFWLPATDHLDKYDLNEFRERERLKVLSYLNIEDRNERQSLI